MKSGYFRVCPRNDVEDCLATIEIFDHTNETLVENVGNKLRRIAIERRELGGFLQGGFAPNSNDWKLIEFWQTGNFNEKGINNIKEVIKIAKEIAKEFNISLEISKYYKQYV